MASLPPPTRSSPSAEEFDKWLQTTGYDVSEVEKLLAQEGDGEQASRMQALESHAVAW